MKKANTNLRYAALYFLLLAIGLHSCQFEKIKDELSPDVIASFNNESEDILIDGVCNFEVRGRLLDSKTCKVIQDTRVEVIPSDEDITSDFFGNFGFSVKFEALQDSVVIIVNKPDYAESRFVIRAEDYFEVDDCKGDMCYYTYVDFLLTPKQPAQTITYLWGEWFIEDEITSFIDGKEGENCVVNYHINIPEHTVGDDVSVDVVYTPLDLRHYFCGNFPEEPIVAMFEAKPEGFVFDIPLELDFTPGRELPADAILMCYYFDETTMSWIKDEDAILEYKFKKVNVAIDQLSCLHLITYTVPAAGTGEPESNLVILEDELVNGDDIIDNFFIGNCDCSDVKVIDEDLELDRTMEKLRFPGKEVEGKEMEILLNDLRRIYCLPAFASGPLTYTYEMMEGSTLCLDTKVKTDLKPFMLNKCDNREIF
ncbi:MAG: hypothetical protein AAFO94_18315, partial [Bacteroidota bacterium]